MTAVLLLPVFPMISSLFASASRDWKNQFSADLVLRSAVWLSVKEPMLSGLRGGAHLRHRRALRLSASYAGEDSTLA